MSIISVEGKSLGAELAVWGVPHNYAVAFAEKAPVKMAALRCIRSSSMTPNT